MLRILPLAFLILCLGAGCSSAPKPAPFSVGGEIVQLNLLTMPVGLNLDGQPGVDGVAVKVYANNASNPKTIPIPSGTLEILAWDGTLFGKTNVPPPLKIWTFTAAELRAMQFESGIGAGYDLILRWGAAVPSKNMMTVAGRYTSPEGRVITSHPSSVTVID